MDEATFSTGHDFTEDNGGTKIGTDMSKLWRTLFVRQKMEMQLSRPLLAAPAYQIWL
jgi:hypothetical protein